jgi:hypothetical protein
MTLPQRAIAMTGRHPRGTCLWAFPLARVSDSAGVAPLMLGSARYEICGHEAGLATEMFERYTKTGA